MSETHQIKQFNLPISGRLPEPGQVVIVRERPFTVIEIDSSQLPLPAHIHDTQTRQHLVELSSVEDEGLGEKLEVKWELEPGAVCYEKALLPGLESFDAPNIFDAFLDAVRWGSVSSADNKALQAPFCSGIDVDDYHLDPLEPVLSMPRVNLLVADDVDLGKTIVAGLVLQEFTLRHRARSILIVCPSSMQIQWGDHPSYPRPSDLLIVDEAHNVAPSSRGRYATDSLRTAAIRTIAPHFEHKLFLSATPHNGYSESFCALLELLDSQRFARAVPPNRNQLQAVMVRLMKSDLELRWDGSRRFSKRIIKHLEVLYTETERQIHRTLQRYSELRSTSTKSAGEQFATEFVLKLLKKRLFSSPAAFAIRAIWRRTAELLSRLPRSGKPHLNIFSLMTRFFQNCQLLHRFDLTGEENPCHHRSISI